MLSDLSLKWRIYWFYLVLGFIPLLVIVYFGVRAYTRSIESITDRHVSQLVRQIAQQTDLRYRQTRQDMRHISRLPYIRRSFHEFHNPLQLDLVQEKLESTRRQTGYLNILALYSNQMERLVSTAAATQTTALDRWVKTAPATPPSEDLFDLTRGSALERHLVFFSRVQAFHDSKLPAGYLVGCVPLTYLAEYLRELKISPGTVRSIKTLSGDPVYFLEAVLSTPGAKAGMRTYSAEVEDLKWRIRINIPEDELFADVRLLMFQTLSFTTVVVLLAGIASLVFSRRFMRPFDTILTGTRAFAKGDLDHRIAIPKGREAKRLAQAFNIMADQLNDRQLALVQSNKLAALGLLSAGIAHEIKNPLAGIKTSAQVLCNLVAANQGQSPGPDAGTACIPAGEEIKLLLDGIVAEVDRLNKIVMGLLKFGRPGPSQKENCRIDRIMARAVKLIQKETSNKQITVDLSLFECKAEVDPDQLLQVFINLLLNAVAAVRPRWGKIAVAVSCNESGPVRVSIKDNGRGISEDKLDRIFDPFFTLTPDGTGLGLSVAYTLLQQNNIKVAVNSRVNRGTDFILTFCNCNITSQGR